LLSFDSGALLLLSLSALLRCQPLLLFLGTKRVVSLAEYIKARKRQTGWELFSLQPRREFMGMFMMALISWDARTKRESDEFAIESALLARTSVLAPCVGSCPCSRSGIARDLAFL